MSRISQTDVEQLAVLAALELSDEEKATFAAQLEEVLDYFAKIQQLDTDEVPPITHPQELRNVMREDEPAPAMPREDALRNAFKAQEGYFVAPEVFGGEG